MTPAYEVSHSAKFILSVLLLSFVLTGLVLLAVIAFNRPDVFVLMFADLFARIGGAR